VGNGLQHSGWLLRVFLTAKPSAYTSADSALATTPCNSSHT